MIQKWYSARHSHCTWVAGSSLLLCLSVRSQWLTHFLSPPEATQDAVLVLLSPSPLFSPGNIHRACGEQVAIIGQLGWFISKPKVGCDCRIQDIFSCKRLVHQEVSAWFVGPRMNITMQWENCNIWLSYVDLPRVYRKRILLWEQKDTNEIIKQVFYFLHLMDVK